MLARSKTGNLTLLFTDVVYLAHFTGFEFFHFAVDSQGNLYVSLTRSGKMVQGLQAIGASDSPHFFTSESRYWREWLLTLHPP